MALSLELVDEFILPNKSMRESIAQGYMVDRNIFRGVDGRTN